MGRKWEVFSRAINPFKGANEEKLRELHKLIFRLGPQFNPLGVAQSGPMVGAIPVDQFVYGKFNFLWISQLTGDEYRDLFGEWTAEIQRQSRSQAAAVATTVNPHQFVAAVPPAQADVIMRQCKNAEFWRSLQQTKDHYRAIGHDRDVGFFSSALAYLNELRTKASGGFYENGLFGQYASKMEMLDNVYADAAVHGVHGPLDNQVLVAGGLYRVLKCVCKAAVHGAMLHPHLIVKKLMTKFNILAGMIAGLGQLALGREASFAPLTGQLGIDAYIAKYKKKYLGPGLHRDGDSLRKQVIDGPGRLRKDAEVTEYDMDRLRGVIARSEYWAEVWQKDVDEIERDLKQRPDQATRVVQLQRAAGSDAATQTAQVQAAAEAIRIEQQRQARKLREKIDSMRRYYGDRIGQIDELLASSNTRTSIAKTQARHASAGLPFDIMRQIATEASTFDRSQLKSTRPRMPSSQSTKPARPMKAPEKALRTEIADAVRRAGEDLDLEAIADQLEIEAVDVAA